MGIDDGVLVSGEDGARGCGRGKKSQVQESFYNKKLIVT